MKRKILSLILVFAMTVSLLTVGTGAVEPTYGDTAGHWAESSIERWSAYGIIQGSNGQFDPNGQLTCAQLATILAKLLKLPAAKDAGFTDNTADAWYYDAINRCAAAGILNGNGDGTVTPEAPITRERAMVMLARALGIEPIRKPDLTKYTDAAQVSAYAQGYVAALIEAGIVGGVTADELAPQDNINRASTVTILDRAISTYADKAGATVKADGKGLVLVVAENVKITGAPEGTKIVVADGATGLTVNGKSVSDDQTYIVPKTEPAKPSSGSSGGYSHSHSYTETITTPATCTADGEKKLTCSCGDTKTEVIPALGHDVNGVAYIPNGDAHLRHYQECKRCKEKIFADCTYEMTPGETEDTYKCSVCGDTYRVAKDSAVRIGEAGYTTLGAALEAATEGNNTIVLLKDLEVAAQINVTKSVTIEGAGHTIKANNASWLTENSNKHLLNIQNTSNVTVQNLTLDSNKQACGNQAFNATDVTFTNVTMKNSLNAGLLVNRSEVTANGLTTSDNVWGGVNVDPKADNDKLHFTLTGNSSLGEPMQIWAEKVNGPAVVTATGYYCHLIKDEKNREFYAWSTSVSDTAVAKVKVGEVDVYYTSLEKALSETTGTVEITLVKDATLDSGATGIPQEQTRNITITGTKDITLALKNTAPGSEGSLNYQDGANLSFNGITVDASKIAGICARGATVTFENCVFNTELKQTIANKFVFTGCTFTQPVSQVGYGCKEVLFDNCKFSTNGYGIKIYSEGSTPVDLTVKNCAFKNTDGAAKSAIFLDHIIDGISYSINVEKCTFEGFTSEPTPNDNKWATRVIVSDSFVKSGDQYVFSYQTGAEGGSYHKILTAQQLVVKIDGEDQVTAKVDTYQALKDAIGFLGKTDLTLDITANVTVPEGETWTPISVDGSQGNGTLTINGNGHKIVGLNAPLVANTWAGKSNCIIKGLTLENANIVVDENDANGNVGVGAFIGQPCASQIITLENCNLVNSTVKGGHWAGGLIGVSGGYNGTDGPVFENVTIKNCSVTGSTIESKGSVGAIIGHAAWDSATRVDITGCTVTGNTVKSTGSSNDKAGSLMGTVGCAGSNQVNSDLEPHAEPGVFVTNCTVNDNNVTSNTTTITEVYGRQGSTGGKLVVDGVTKCQ